MRLWKGSLLNIRKLHSTVQIIPSTSPNTKLDTTPSFGFWSHLLISHSSTTLPNSSHQFNLIRLLRSLASNGGRVWPEGLTNEREYIPRECSSPLSNSLSISLSHHNLRGNDARRRHLLFLLLLLSSPFHQSFLYTLPDFVPVKYTHLAIFAPLVPEYRTRTLFWLTRGHIRSLHLLYTCRLRQATKTSTNFQNKVSGSFYANRK